VGQFHWTPGAYLELMHEEVPQYERLQDESCAATGIGARRVLDLGTGTGETARRVLDRHPRAALLGIDASDEMLAHARATLPAGRFEARVRRLEDPLPPGPFDAVISVLAVHHLDGKGKADLFHRVAAVLAPGGRFVVGDVVVPGDPDDAVTPIDPGYDKPSRVSDQLGWLDDAGLDAGVAWCDRDLAVLAAVPATA
jgi:tRNA (cmo5U34)-methyltransferase